MANQKFFNLSGGVNSKMSPLIIQDTECEQILNYNLDTVGALTKRRGYNTPLTHTNLASGKEIRGLFYYTNTATSAETTSVVVANNSADTQSVIFYLSTLTWTNSKTNDTAFGSFGNLEKARFAVFLDYLFRVNGDDVVATSINVNGAAWGTTNAPGTIEPAFIAIFQDRVYVANDRASTPDGSRVFFSSLPSAGAITWNTATDFFDVNPDDGDEITGLENNGNRLLIFKKKAMYRWTFGQTEPDRIIGVGTQSQECIKTNFDLGITFFANAKGVYASEAGGRPKFISRKIQKWFDNLASTDPTYFAGEVDEDHYYLYISDEITIDDRTYTNVMVVYTISLDAWVIYTLGVPVRIMAHLVRGDIDEIHFGSNNSRTYRFNNGNNDEILVGSTDTNEPIAAEILFKEQMLSFPDKAKLNNMYVVAKQHNNANVFAYLDRAEDPVSLGNLTKRINAFPLPKKNVNSIQLFISDNSQTISQIEGYDVEYEPTNVRDRKPQS